MIRYPETWELGYIKIIKIQVYFGRWVEVGIIYVNIRGPYLSASIFNYLHYCITFSVFHSFTIFLTTSILLLCRTFWNVWFCSARLLLRYNWRASFFASFFLLFLFCLQWRMHICWLKLIIDSVCWNASNITNSLYFAFSVLFSILGFSNWLY